jgi:multiple sugar transport system permease protein
MMRRRRSAQVLIYSLLGVFVLFFTIPIIWTILLAIRPAGTNLSVPPVVFFEPTLQHFRYTFIQPGLSTGYLVNSLLVSLLATAVSLPFSIPAAYAFARYRFRGKKFLIFFFLGLFLGPPVVFLLPYVIIMTRLGLVGTYASMVIVFQTITIPFSILVMRSFLQEIPIELEESAWIDGAGKVYTVIRIVLPLALPGIIVAAMFAFVFSWNNAVFPLVLSRSATRPLPIGTLAYFAVAGINWNYIAITSVITMLPPMALFLSLEKYLVRGLTFGAVKG